MKWFCCTWTNLGVTHVRMVLVVEGRIAGSNIAYPFSFGRDWKAANAAALSSGWVIEPLPPAEME